MCSSDVLFYNARTVDTINTEALGSHILLVHSIGIPILRIALINTMTGIKQALSVKYDYFV